MYEHRYQEASPHGSPDFPFHIYTIQHAGHVHSILPIHWHNELEIIYLVKGRATFKIENCEYPIQSGDALIVHPGELHSGTSTDFEGIFYYSIVFKLSWLSALYSDRIQENFLIPVLKGSIRLPAMLSTAVDSHLEALDSLRRLLQLAESQQLAYEMGIKANLLLLLSSFFRRGLTETVSLKKTRRVKDANHQIKHLLVYMEEHSRDKLNLDQLAAVLSLSRSHFCKLFKERTGMRPMEYLNFIRVNKAATLLRTGSYNVLEAALESGFHHVSYFSKWFKVYMKMTPSDYKAYYASGV